MTLILNDKLLFLSGIDILIVISLLVI